MYYQQSYNRPDDLKQAKSSFLRNFGVRKFDKKEDYDVGIYHVLVGQNSGIVKQINFSHTSDPHMNTLFSIKNPNVLAPYLRYSYEANLDLFGNDLFFNKILIISIINYIINIFAEISISVRKRISNLINFIHQIL